MKKLRLHSLIALAAAALCTAGLAQEVFPGEDWQDRPNPLADPAAVPGGAITLFGGQYPKSFNVYLDNNALSAEIFGLQYESLLSTDPITAEYVPGLADRWTVSDDKRTFTFHIDPRARWSDGKPVTAHDVCWTFGAIMNPSNLTGVHKVSLEQIDPPEALDERTVRFHAREVHWRNLGAVGGFAVLPRHAYRDRDFNKLHFTFPVVSGPYRIEDMQEGRSLTLARREDWWARAQQRHRHVFNFDEIRYRFFSNRGNAFEAFKQGTIDLFPVYTARRWVRETGGPRFMQNWIVRQNVHNYKPIGFQGFAMNLRREPFDDLRVRKALAHLLNREKMNRTLMYDQYFLQRSYYEDLYTPEHPCTNPQWSFAPQRARELLHAAGWRADPETGLLTRDGQPFRIRFLARNQSADKFLAIYAEDLKDAGIELTIDRKDLASWAKDMDRFHFDMTWASWGSGLFKDPEGMWASAEAERRGGNNITGFRDERVDELIEKQKTMFDVQQRHALCREIDALVAEQVPYILLWNIDSVRLLYWNKFGTPPTVLSRYGDERSALTYWWYDPDSAAELQDARELDLPLPPRPAEIVFDDRFQP